MKIVLATGNAHKAAEFAELWPDARVSGGPDGHSVEETGTTFLQNAWIKAAALRPLAAPDAIVMADDSGLAVTALGGRPGGFSARYAGPDADDAANCARLLDELGDGDDRRAAFVCVLVALTPDERMLVASGCCDGRIAPALRGRGGFGYDPLFIPSGDTRTMAELTREEKSALSHRGRAARRMGALLGMETR
ncbi:MAG TPA: RdgB/HAM1 family non-canonical purine NTP pyrophosphatase [Miltoncostaeaceae bacterium]|nr:RdgB/HAM1 family non-canonical purine NTP pyrophosphatase [Miltoncostaeaceae bacterium]